ncbi:hypothetical protein OV079_23655 [Nannocystis pusilla]|uniref:DNA binding HTH domain-containing protein n=1 Tax=Nannocystis pusilla TaxID=889268 RepID=A0A9X3EQX8_9BACT|nr:helix-turn-helix domain-containing protein [Nannocystis pusilla]MCY1008498.1 hypothetical protein [Nannocystis pusilla]
MSCPRPKIVLDSLNLDAMYHQLLSAALERAGSLSEAADLLGVSLKRLRVLCIKHKIETRMLAKFDVEWPPRPARKARRGASACPVGGAS